MSTETTNKKIKIDNGTTFGRTYTDKAVDELLKNAGGGGISVIELTDKNGTIASAQLDKINANPQNFSFKYNGKILLFTSADSTNYQYCNNTTSSSDNNVMTTSTLLTIASSTGAYTIAENVHNVVANSIHPANGGDLTNIQVGSKVYSIPSGGGGGTIHLYSVLINSENDRFYYIASSATDYGNHSIFVLNFATDKTYSDLHKVGKSYPLSGYCYSGEQMCPAYELSIIDLDNYPFQVNVFNPATKKVERLIKGEAAAATISKLL